MRRFIDVILLLALSLSSCAPASKETIRPATQPLAPPNPNSLQSLHLRLDVSPADGSVTYLGWYDGRRNLLGPGGITAALVGIEPPEFREAKLDKPTPSELRFRGVDHNHIAWEKTYRLDPAPG